MAVEPMRFVFREKILDGKQSVHANVAVVKKPAVFPTKSQSFLPHYHFFDTHQQTDTATSLDSLNNNVLGLCSQSALLHFLQFFK